MGLWKSILDLLIDPNLIVILMSIGILGITIELWNPGLILPGTVGAIALVIGLFGLQVLPISWAGLLLMALALGFFVAEAFVVSHGALALAGAIAFVIGSLMLFDPAGENYQVSLQVALIVAATMAAMIGFAALKIVQVRRAPGRDGRVGARRPDRRRPRGARPGGLRLRPRRALARADRTASRFRRARRSASRASTKA